MALPSGVALDVDRHGKGGDVRGVLAYVHRKGGVFPAEALHAYAEGVHALKAFALESRELGIGGGGAYLAQMLALCEFGGFFGSAGRKSRVMFSLSSVSICTMAGVLSPVFTRVSGSSTLARQP